MGDTEELAKKSGATIVTEMDMANDYAQKGFKVEGPNYGGTVHFDWGDVKIIPAWHTTANVPLGMATGLALTIEGKLIYIAGDTGLFSDMKLVGRKQQIDLAFLPIGDYYTMGPDDAAYAASLIDAKKVIPYHFNTFPPIKQDVNDFWKNVPENMKFIAEIDKPFELENTKLTKKGCIIFRTDNVKFFCITVLLLFSPFLRQNKRDGPQRQSN